MCAIDYGFASSHDDCEFVSDKYFQINNCGFLVHNQFEKDKRISKRPPRKDHMIVYFTKGDGLLELDKRIYELHQGDMLYLSPGTPIALKPDFKSQHYWIHFTGACASEILSSSGISNSGVYRIGHSSTIENLFSEISFNLTNRSNAVSLNCIGLFLQLLSHVANNNNDSNSSENDLKIRPALLHMNVNYFEDCDLQFYADLCDMSLSSFKHTFRKVAHIAPMSYINSIRIGNAKRMLLTTQMSVNQISDAIGYNTSQYFSRIFKKYTGYTPMEYRTQKSK